MNYIYTILLRAFLTKMCVDSMQFLSVKRILLSDNTRLYGSFTSFKVLIYVARQVHMSLRLKMIIVKPHIVCWLNLQQQLLPRQ